MSMQYVINNLGLDELNGAVLIESRYRWDGGEHFYDLYLTKDPSTMWIKKHGVTQMPGTEATKAFEVCIRAYKKSIKITLKPLEEPKEPL